MQSENQALWGEIGSLRQKHADLLYKSFLSMVDYINLKLDDI